ncbi:methylation-associated defense system protein MAD7 [Ktedonobacter robiniae]|uniref:Uncharacterized protein n=1 Tax=Ktedonobacter robiniae TaxID=2778365 RepID=A0ABQ3UUC6_9CHLR|nr:hypothetical protein [Ktedonobacter robiniae]GHO56030.1 hypothetical protein KSB_45050 [Ktedonobacter robiniae]
MPIKLTKEEQEFRKPLIAHFDAKAVNLDRMLVNLFMLIKYGGRRPVTTRARGEVTIDSLYERLTRDPNTQKGLSGYPEITKKWLSSDLIDVVSRGEQGKEAVAAPIPLSLDAYKLRNTKYTRDYNSSDQAYNMLYAGDPDIIKCLRECFGEREATPAVQLDLDTLVIKRLVSDKDLHDTPSSDNKELLIPLLSQAPARLLADDVRRLLAYQEVVPRHVMLDYLKTILGIHMGLYMLRLFSLLPGWVKVKRTGGTCEHCLGPSKNDFMIPCLYKPLLLIDMGNDYQSTMATMSQANALEQFARINDYIKAVFTVNQLLYYLNNDFSRRGEPASVQEALATYHNPPADFEIMFKLRLNTLFQELDHQRQDADDPGISSRKQAKEQAQWSEIDAIRDMQLSPFEMFIEVVSYIRTPFHQKYHIALLDSLLQKNEDTGLVRQGRSRKNGRRFHIGSRLLEVLVQIAVLEQDGPNHFRSRPILIDELVRWLLDRYGFVINGLDVPALAEQAGVRELAAYRDNLRALKDRLREIGFYIDLSDAYNAQTIRPRYRLEGK